MQQKLEKKITHSTHLLYAPLNQFFIKYQNLQELPTQGKWLGEFLQRTTNLKISDLGNRAPLSLLVVLHGLYDLSA